MKRILLIVFFSILFNFAKSQLAISPSLDDEYCPNTEYTFTVTIPKAYQSMMGVGGSFVTQLPSSPVGATFTFKGKFADANQKQSFQVSHPDGTITPFEFKKIKSFHHANACSQIAS